MGEVKKKTENNYVRILARKIKIIIKVSGRAIIFLSLSLAQSPTLFEHFPESESHSLEFSWDFLLSPSLVSFVCLFLEKKHENELENVFSKSLVHHSAYKKRRAHRSRRDRVERRRGKNQFKQPVAQFRVIEQQSSLLVVFPFLFSAFFFRLSTLLSSLAHPTRKINRERRTPMTTMLRSVRWWVLKDLQIVSL